MLEKSKYLSGKHLKRGAENTMKKLPFDILHIVPSDSSRNEEVPHNRAKRPQPPIIKTHVRSRTAAAVDAHDLQAVSGPEESRDTGGAPHHEWEPNWLRRRALLDASIGDAVEGGSERGKDRESPKNEVLLSGCWLLGVWKVPWWVIGG